MTNGDHDQQAIDELPASGQQGVRTDPVDIALDHDQDNAYSALIEANDDSRWAFGNGFDDPLAGMDASVAEGIDAAGLGQYCLMLGDDALTLAQRLTEWATHAPELEEEVALANISLDLLGQARLLLGRAATADPELVPTLPEGSPVPDEDRLAFFRDSFGFCNVRLTEQPDGDFATTIARLLIFASWRLELLRALTDSADEVLAGIAGKAVKEVCYHRDYASRWFQTLAQGTEFSRDRMMTALETVWPYVAELGRVHPTEARLRGGGVAADPEDAWRQAAEHVDTVLSAAGIDRPAVHPAGPLSGKSGRDGLHSEHLGYLLDEMQSVARTHPMARW